MGNHVLPQIQILWFMIIHGNKKGGASLPTSTKEEVKLFFRQFDTNGDGMLNFKELKNAFTRLRVKAPFWEALKAMNLADENGDFRISEHELDVLAEFVLERGISIPS